MNKYGHYKWTDKEIKRWAKKYTATNKATLYSVESDIDVCHSTLWWCFVNRLVDIDKELYDKVMKKLKLNKHKGGRKCLSAKRPAEA